MKHQKNREKKVESKNTSKPSNFKSDRTYKIYSCKLQVKSRKQKIFLQNVFAEARIVHNYFVKQINLNNISSSIKDNIHLPHISRSAIDKIWDELLAKHSKRKPIKYVRAINSLYLGKHKEGYILHLSNNRVNIYVADKICSEKTNYFFSFRILGLHRVLRRFDGDAVPKSAYLVARPSGYYLQVLFEVSGAKLQELDAPEFGYPIAIDFGMSSKLTISNGIKIDFEFAIPDRIAKLESTLREYPLAKKKTKRIILSIRKFREHLYNKINDTYHKISKCIFLYNQIIIQDDYVSGWANIKNSVDTCKLHILKKRILDRAKNTDVVSFNSNNNEALRFNNNSIPIQELRNKRLILLNRYERTTKTCFVCEHKLDVDKRTRKVTCSKCGWTTDRDINATLIMLRKYAKYSSYEILTRFCNVSLDEISRFYRILGNIREVQINLYANRTS